MLFILPNALIDTYRNGTYISELSGRSVQIDDDKSEKESNYNGVPVLAKQMFDVPGVPYKRGDRIIITYIDGHGATIPDDFVFWVLRSDFAGNPLPATKIGLLGGLPTNTQFMTRRGKEDYLTSVRGHYVISGPERFEATLTTGGLGASLAGTIYIPDTTTDIRQKDIIVFLEEDDQPDLDAQTKYTTHAVLRSPAPCPFIRVDIWSANQ